MGDEKAIGPAGEGTASDASEGEAPADVPAGQPDERRDPRGLATLPTASIADHPPTRPLQPPEPRFSDRLRAYAASAPEAPLAVGRTEAPAPAWAVEAAEAAHRPWPAAASAAPETLTPPVTAPNEAHEKGGAGEEPPATPAKAGSTTSQARRQSWRPRTLRRPRRPTSGRAWEIARVAATAVVLLSAGWLALVVALTAAFAFLDPPTSALMLIRRMEGTAITRQPVPVSAISPHLVRAVIASEDGRFCQHWGIDPGEIARAISEAGDDTPRGASTITTQLAKNLYLWPQQSYLRKALEVPITFAIEALWSKARIAEVYLNLVEWGPGVFGAEAAARYHFGKPAAALSPAEAARLAVSLPNPLRRSAGRPSPLVHRLAGRIQARVRANARIADCVLAGDRSAGG
ncbi:MAG: monofunctional biosynthetic peptidoglycan transglycosylase [Hyphomicrobiaceae bacterium]|nr:monofunctional biosynthetic peptidoglycan transglycosylase [Hyphomicrobiaceae bacterium]